MERTKSAEEGGRCGGTTPLVTVGMLGFPCRTAAALDKEEAEEEEEAEHQRELQEEEEALLEIMVGKWLPAMVQKTRGLVEHDFGLRWDAVHLLCCAGGGGAATWIERVALALWSNNYTPPQQQSQDQRQQRPRRLTLFIPSRRTPVSKGIRRAVEQGASLEVSHMELEECCVRLASAVDHLIVFSLHNKKPAAGEGLLSSDLLWNRVGSSLSPSLRSVVHVSLGDLLLFQQQQQRQPHRLPVTVQLVEDEEYKVQRQLQLQEQQAEEEEEEEEKEGRKGTGRAKESSVHAPKRRKQGYSSSSAESQTHIEEMPSSVSPPLHRMSLVPQSSPLSHHHRSQNNAGTPPAFGQHISASPRKRKHAAASSSKDGD